MQINVLQTSFISFFGQRNKIFQIGRTTERKNTIYVT